MKGRLLTGVFVLAAGLLIASGTGLAALVREAWVARYNGPGDSDDEARAVAVDASGNVYVTGISRGALSSDDYTTIKYARNGAELWVARYNGPGNLDDCATAVAVDASGNVYVTGGSRGTSSDAMATVKYAPDGTELWVARFDGPAGLDDGAFELVVDGAGYVYVTGYCDGGFGDYATVKYSPDGAELWSARYDGTGSGPDAATGIAVDGSGAVFVAGESHGGASDDDYATIKYAADGSELWVARYDGPASGLDKATAMTVDRSGNVAVTGWSDAAKFVPDYATVKYAPDGTELWAARYDGPGNDRDVAFAAAADAAGNVIVTGYSMPGPARSDYATIKYAPDGTELWVARYNGPGAGSGARSIAADAAGNIYVTGASANAASVNDYATVKYAADGTELWVARYDGPSGGDDMAVAVAVDAAGNAYVAGGSAGTGTDFATVKYTENLLPAAEAGGPYEAECSGGPVAIPLDASGSSDPEGGALEFAWTTDCPGGSFDDPASPQPVLTVNASRSCAVACTAMLAVTDPAGETAAASADVTVRDTEPPVMDPNAGDLGCLWPPDHRYVCLDRSRFAPAIRDRCGSVAAWRFADCRSDQPDDRGGPGRAESDCRVEAGGESVCVRAERSGSAPEGRRYSLTAVAEDECGNRSGAQVIGYIHVPHDGSGHEDCIRTAGPGTSRD